MSTGFRGTFVIPWSQTELDGLKAAPVVDLRVGAMWQWDGEAVRVDGPQSVLPLAPPESEVELRRRAGLTVRRLMAASGTPFHCDQRVTLQRPLFDNTFSVTDGESVWEVVVIPMGAGRKPLLMFHAQLPPRGAELWVVRCDVSGGLVRQVQSDPGGVICFTPGTLIATPYGPRDVGALREGDFVQTRDNGPAEILWMGQRRVSGARLMAMPHLAPVRLRRGALDHDVPDAGLLVSPDHRVLVTGPRAQTLFGSDEVLVAARDLVNDQTVIVDRAVRQVTYVHMMLQRHEIVFANGVPTETFHPASAELAAMEPDEAARMFQHMPELGRDAALYGGYARRILGASEAAILRHEHVGARH